MYNLNRLMKYLLMFFFLTTCFGVSQIYAQNNTSQTEIIIIEIFAPNHTEPEKLQIPINRRKNENLDEGIGSVSHCVHCNEEDRALLPIDFTLRARAFRMGKNKVNIGVELSVNEDRCRTTEIFGITRNKKTKVKLKCGVTLFAYYDFESKEKSDVANVGRISVVTKF